MNGRTRTTPPTRKNKPHKPIDWPIVFLRELASHNNVGRACRAAKISRTEVRMRKQSDAAFAAAYAEAQEDAADAIEAEIWRRGVEGILRGVYYAGERVAVEKQYSDRMLELAARAYRPDKYRERVQLDIDLVQSEIDQLMRRLLAANDTAALPAPAAAEAES